MASVETPARADARAHSRGPAVLAALINGVALAEIAELEDLTPKRVEKMLRDELRKRWIAPAQDYARLQIARLEAIAAQLKEKARSGDLPTIDRLLKVMDRLDRYHGFTKLVALPTRARRGARAMLFNKMMQAGERRRAAMKPAPAAQGGVRRRSCASPDERARRSRGSAERRSRRSTTIGRCGRGRSNAPPEGDWIYWLILAGRGAGKTRAGRRDRAGLGARLSRRQPDRRDAAATRATSWCSANPACSRSARARERPRFARASDRLEWPNGAVSQIFSAEEPDRLRGKQHMKLWLDELAAWRDPDAFDQAMLGLRLGDKPQAVITTTPRPTQAHQTTRRRPARGRHARLDLRQCALSRRRFPQAIAARFEGRAIGRQELYAEIVEEAPGALWTRALIERQRLPARPRRWTTMRRSSSASIRRPARARSPTSAASSSSGAPRARRSMCSPISPARARRRANGRRGSSRRIRRFAANRVVAEINNGGEMVAQVLRQSDANLPVRSVTATRGKFLRAEPVAAAYERGIGVSLRRVRQA